MGYTYAITPAAMFEDRFGQFIMLGIPRADVEDMRSCIVDMWADAPGGWTFEWSRLARRYREAAQPLLASLAYGCAKFPCLANAARHKALEEQVDAYLAAAPSFPVKFERRLVDLPFQDARVKLPVHLYSADGAYGRAPVLLFNGGVDTWKMDSHGMCVALAQRLGITVAAFDQPGTGENPVAMTIEADEIVLGLAQEARQIGDGRVGHFGTSFGANYAAMTGLSGAVDCAVLLGAPVEAAFASEALGNLPYGMPDIIGNDMGFDQTPPPAVFASEIARFSRRALLQRPGNAPMLVINGADDYFVPQADTRLFEGRPDTEVHLLEGTGHCAFLRLPEVMSLVLRWLTVRLPGSM